MQRLYAFGPTSVRTSFTDTPPPQRPGDVGAAEDPFRQTVPVIDRGMQGARLNVSTFFDALGVHGLTLDDFPISTKPLQK